MKRYEVVLHVNAVGEISEDVDGIVVPYAELGVGTLVPRFPDPVEVSEIADEAREHGLEVEVMFDAVCLGGAPLSTDGGYLAELDVMLEDVNPDGVVVADPYLVEVLNGRGPRVVVSHTAWVDGPEKARFFADLGADVLTLDPHLNDDPDAVIAVKSAVPDVDLRAAVGALSCSDPVVYFERNLASHLSIDGRVPSPYRDDPYRPMVRCESSTEPSPEVPFDEVIYVGVEGLP